MIGFKILILIKSSDLEKLTRCKNSGFICEFYIDLNLANAGFEIVN